MNADGASSGKIPFWERISVEQVKIELMRTVFRHSGTPLSRFDPRMLVIWYTFFAVAPWFIHNKTVLLGLLLPVAALTWAAKASLLVLLVLVLGLATDTAYLMLVTLFFGGGVETAWALSTLTLKLTIIALAGIAVFGSMDPERLSDALYSLGLPASFSFGVSYGYRMLPILIGEYSNLLHSYRLRGREPAGRGFRRLRRIAYRIRIAVKAFYPLMLNTAKRTRTTVEALEVKGFTYAAASPRVRKIRLSHLRFRSCDALFLLASVLYVGGVFWLGARWPL